MSLGNKIKQRRQELGLTQEELAQKVGYTDKSMISKIESGKTNPPVVQIERIAKALGTPSAELTGWDQPERATNRIITTQLLMKMYGWNVHLDEEDASLFLIRGNDAWEITEEQLNDIADQTGHFMNYLLTNLANESKKVR